MEIFDLLLKFATLRPRSEFEIRQWFKRKKVDEKEAQKLFNQLKSMGFVDDEAFARWWISQRVEFRPKSRALLLREVMQKGVDKELARKVIEEVDQEIPTDYELAFQLIEKKKKSWERLDPESRKKKIIYFLQSRGFSWEIIRKFLR